MASLTPMTGPPTIPSPRRSLWLLAFAFVAVVGLFLTGTVISQLAGHSRELNLKIVTEVGPSIRILSAARVDVRELELRLQESLDALEHHRPPDQRAVLRALSAMNEAFSAYAQLPPAGANHEVGQLADHTRLIERQLDDFWRAADFQDLRQARAVFEKALRPELERVLELTHGWVEQDAVRTERLAGAAADSRRNSERLAFLLNISAGLFAFLAAGLALRELLRFQRLSQAHAGLLQRRADELEQFSARVAHDILSPLMSVSLALELADRRSPEGARVHEALLRGQASLRQVRGIVDGLFQFARAGASPEPDSRADVDAVLEDLTPPLQREAEESQVELTVQAEPDCGEVACSPGILSSILSNLIRNAIKYVRRSPRRQVRVRLLRAGGRVRIEVEDTGPGLPPGSESQMFLPYVRAPGVREPGLGLGLATVKKLCDAHHGAVGVVSHPGQGCLFWAELPPAHAPAPAAQASPQADSHAIPSNF